MTKSKSKAKTKKPRSKYGNPILDAASDLTDAAIAIFNKHGLSASQGLLALGLTGRGLLDAMKTVKREAQQTSHTE